MLLLCPAPRGGGCVQAGDLVVVYEGHDSMRVVTVAPGTVLRCRHGAFPHAAWVGVRYGARVSGTDGRGWLLLLRPTPALWTRVLRHRTQILYAPDIANIVANLALSPGRVVLESGTGSGSLTTSLARAVAPSGRVFTFEFHAQRAELARADFALTGVADVVRVFVRDTEATGFPASLAGAADAVFLDLPGPHRVAPSAVASLRPDGMLCSFSPCIEQVQRMCLALADEGMTEIRTIEVLDREYEFQRKALLLPPPPEAAGEAAAGGAQEGSRKRARGDSAPESSAQVEPQAASADAAAEPQPEPQLEAMEADGGAAAAAPAAAEQPKGKGAQGGERRPRGGPPQAPLPRAEPRLLMWPIAEARGHTGYLTFARKPTEDRSSEAAAAAADDDEAE